MIGTYQEFRARLKDNFFLYLFSKFSGGLRIWSFIRGRKRAFFSKAASLVLAEINHVDFIFIFSSSSLFWVETIWKVMKFLSIVGNSFGCSASGERLVSAARDGDLQEAKALLEYNPRLVRYSTFGVRNSPLHYSAAQGHHEVFPNQILYSF